MILNFNDRQINCDKTQEVRLVLIDVDAAPQFELWASISNGPSMRMLRNGADAWLMYLRNQNDDGYRSSGNPTAAGTANYRLPNGKTDSYPLSWCVEVARCYHAIVQFSVTDGERPNQINWQRSPAYRDW